MATTVHKYVHAGEAPHDATPQTDVFAVAGGLVPHATLTSMNVTSLPCSRSVRARTLSVSIRKAVTGVSVLTGSFRRIAGCVKVSILSYFSLDR